MPSEPSPPSAPTNVVREFDPVEVENTPPVAEPADENEPTPEPEPSPDVHSNEPDEGCDDEDCDEDHLDDEDEDDPSEGPSTLYV